MRYCCDSNGQPVGMPQKHVIGSEAGLDQRQLALWVASQSARQAKHERTVDRAKTNCCWNRFVQSCTSHGQCDAGGEGCVANGTLTAEYGPALCSRFRFHIYRYGLYSYDPALCSRFRFHLYVMAYVVMAQRCAPGFAFTSRSEPMAHLYACTVAARRPPTLLPQSRVPRCVSQSARFATSLAVGRTTPRRPCRSTARSARTTCSACCSGRPLG